MSSGWLVRWLLRLARPERSHKPLRRPGNPLQDICAYFGPVDQVKVIKVGRFQFAHSRRVNHYRGGLKHD
jgi:hypothetical protein